MMTWANVNENSWVSLRHGRVWSVKRDCNGDWFVSHFAMDNIAVIHVELEQTFDDPYNAMIYGNCLSFKYEEVN